MTIRRIAFLCSILAIAGVAADAQSLYQVETRPVRGFMPNMDQLASPLDSIDPVSRKLHLEIPLASLPQGPGGSSFDLKLVYDSHYWDVTPVVLNPPPPWHQSYGPQPGYELTTQPLARGGWTMNIDNIGIDYEEKVGETPDWPQCSDGPQRKYRIRVRLMDGSLHVMHLRGWGTEQGNGYQGDGFFPMDPSGHYRCFFPNGSVGDQVMATGWLTYYSDDGSYLKLETQTGAAGCCGRWKLYFTDGRRVTYDDPLAAGVFGIHLYDANGNGVHYINACYDPPPQGSCSQPYKAIVDDAGHEIQIGNSGATQTSLTTTIRMKGPNTVGEAHWVTWTLNWQVFEIGNDGRQYVMASSAVPWDTFHSLHALAYGLKYVQLPLADPVATGQIPPVWNSYEIGYADDSDHGYGEVDSVRTPTGATFKYRYVLENTQPRSVDIVHNNTARERRVTQPGTTDELVWTYLGAFTNGAQRVRVTNPDLSETLYWFGPTGAYLDTTITGGNLGVGGVVYRIDEPNGSIRKRLWSQNRTISGGYVQNAWVRRETVTVGGSSPQVAVTDRMIDKNGNLVQTKEYDWVAYTESGPETGATLKRVTDISYNAGVPLAPTLTNAAETKAYWNLHFSPLSAGQSRRLDTVARKEVSDNGGNKAAVTEFTYDDPYRRGNMTSEKKWDSVKSVGAAAPLDSNSAQILTRSYDSRGNLTDIYEPRNNPNQEIRTHIDYDSTGSYPTHVDYAHNALEHRSWEYAWNFNAGTLTSKTDLDNHLVTAYGYDDAGRQRLVTEAGQRKTETVYDDPNMKVLVKSDLVSLGDGKLQTETQYDLLGRPSLVRSRETTTPSITWIETKTVYLPAQDITIKSTPYRSAPDSTTGWVCTQTDGLKRVVAVATFKGSSPPANCGPASNRIGLATTTYDANWTTITDPASKTRKERRDALGRLLEVVEDPSGLNYGTSYNYDTLDNLMLVTQGAQTRTFHYSSLGRLKDATNPESGRIDYEYYDSGELKKRTDARGVVAEFVYDPLHRITTKTYSLDPTGTPSMHYEYYMAGEGSPKVGQLRTAYSGLAASSNDTYDSLGRVTSSHHTIAGNNTTFNFQYSYFLNGAVQSVTNPSNRVITYAVDEAGRTKTVTSGPTVYANLTAAGSYTPDGRVAQMVLGNNLWETRSYDVLASGGLTTSYKVGTSPGTSDRLKLDYNFSGTANNGNLLSQATTQPNHAAWTQNYTYDGVNRLASASESGGWSQNFGYDRYGNRWVSSSSGLQWADSHEPTQQGVFNTSTNRLGSVQDYDQAGNQIRFSPFDVKYDAENRMIEAKDTATHMSTYIYDGDGQRVKKTVTSSSTVSTTTYYVHNALGQLAAEYSTLAPTTGTTYIHTDMLGSTRMVTNQNGATLECYDYMPFGRMLSDGVNSRNTGCYPPNPDAQISSNLPQKFTGKERDPETMLDFFGARYYSAAQGRFTSPDAPLADQHPEDPQSWNLYDYALNNPPILIDPDGRQTISARVQPETKMGRLADRTVGAAKSIVRNPLEVLYSFDRWFTGRRNYFVEDTLEFLSPKSRNEALGDFTAQIATIGFIGGTKGASAAGEEALASSRVSAELRVIGHFSDGYVELAQQQGAKFFQMPEKLWEAMSPAQRWTANQKFLDRAIGQKAPFQLATARKKIRRGTDLEKEVNYLLERGYEWSQDGMHLVWGDH